MNFASPVRKQLPENLPKNQRMRAKSAAPTKRVYYGNGKAAGISARFGATPE